MIDGVDVMHSMDSVASVVLRRNSGRLWITAAVLGFIVSTIFLRTAESSAQKSAKNKPRYNVLFIISDDLRPTLGCYGNPIVKTPNIDALAARGTRFERAYAQFPLCNPSRSSLLNGRYPTQTGVMDNNTYFRKQHPDYVTLPEYFKNLGYASLRTGKIFHGGIDDEASWTEGGEPVNPNIVNRPPSPVATGQGTRETDDPDIGPINRPARASTSDRIVVRLSEFRRCAGGSGNRNFRQAQSTQQNDHRFLGGSRLSPG